MSSLALAGYLNAAGLLFYAGVGLGAGQLAKVLYETNFADRASCWRGFTGCSWAGCLVWMGALGDYMSSLSG